MELRAFMDSTAIDAYMRGCSAMNLSHVDTLEMFALCVFKQQMSGEYLDITTVSVDIKSDAGRSRRVTVPITEFYFRLKHWGTA